MMREQGYPLTIPLYRGVQKYSLLLEKRIRPNLRSGGKSWRVDETSIEVKGKWKYLYRAIDSDGNTIDFMLSATRNRDPAYKFLKKILKKQDSPEIINTGRRFALQPLAVRNPAYP